ncbi:hypothetical protein ACQP2U_43415 (plasmid) [Nocardia sp. CA-084685]|uniref:hypothetical protein n=1 Tax=Nocardia sp. CA-084685 TaxID=3239970 RepID=UPI003D96ED47
MSIPVAHTVAHQLVNAATDAVERLAAGADFDSGEKDAIVGQLERAVEAAKALLLSDRLTWTGDPTEDLRPGAALLWLNTFGGPDETGIFYGRLLDDVTLPNATRRQLEVKTESPWGTSVHTVDAENVIANPVASPAAWARVPSVGEDDLAAALAPTTEPAASINRSDAEPVAQHSDSGTTVISFDAVVAGEVDWEQLGRDAYTTGAPRLPAENPVIAAAVTVHEETGEQVWLVPEITVHQIMTDYTRGYEVAETEAAVSASGQGAEAVLPDGLVAATEGRHDTFPPVKHEAPSVASSAAMPEAERLGHRTPAVERTFFADGAGAGL